MVTKEKKAMKKTTRTAFRSSVYDKKRIKVRARVCNLTLSEYCRRAALGQRTPALLTEEEVEIYKGLQQFRNNFVHLANIWHKRNPGMFRKNMEVAELVREHLLKFKK